MTVFAYVVAATAAILLIPALIFFLECFASLFLPSAGRITRPDNLSVAVMIPAHDEREGIGATVTRVRSQLSADDRLVVIADNCTNDTADVTRAAGAEVITRQSQNIGARAMLSRSASIIWNQIPRTWSSSSMRTAGSHQAPSTPSSSDQHERKGRFRPTTSPGPTSTNRKEANFVS